MRRAPGRASRRISCRLPSSSEARSVTPVVLPPGLASERTNPWPTMSSVKARIGIWAIARCAARTAASPPTPITSTPDFASSAACSSICSTRRPYPRSSTARFWPSMKPSRRSSAKKRHMIGRLAWTGEHRTEPINPPGLLRARGERPRGRRAAEQGDEIAAFHSITSSAMASSVGGTANRRAALEGVGERQVEA
jgi:hypothetical protein